MLISFLKCWKQQIQIQQIHSLTTKLYIGTEGKAGFILDTPSQGKNVRNNVHTCAHFKAIKVQEVMSLDYIRKVEFTGETNASTERTCKLYKEIQATEQGSCQSGKYQESVGPDNRK